MLLRGALAAAATLAAGLLLAGPAAVSADPGAGSAAQGLRVQVLRTSQQAILGTGRLTARVTVKAPGKVWIVPRIRQSSGGNRSYRVSGAKRLRFRGRGSRSRIVKFRLTGAGRSLVAGCRSKRLIFFAKFQGPRLRRSARGSTARARNRRARHTASALIRRDRPVCNAPGVDPDDDGPPPTPYQGPPIGTGASDRCDFLDQAVCLQPYPSDYVTTADPSTDTGRRINLNLLSMPRNKAGKPIDNAELNRNDGYSPGSMLITKVPGLDRPEAFEQTGAVGIDDLRAYDDPSQPIVVINAETGERHPIWSEIDYNPLDPVTGGSADNAADRADVNLLVRPAVNWDESTRYIVALRRMRDAAGNMIPPAAAFRVYRDRLITGQPEIEGRRAHMESLFTKLKGAGIGRSDLYLAWDFTTASERNLTDRMLKIRDDAFAQLGDSNLADLTVQGSAPDFSIDAVENFAPCGNDGCQSGEDRELARKVTGTITVPCYLNTPGCAPVGSTFNYAGSGDGLPAQAAGNTHDATFTCNIPRVAPDGPAVTSAKPSLYGHGLLGSGTEVGAGNVQAMGLEQGFLFCATDWYGFATQNIANILAILQDASLFPLLADGSQQGYLNFLYLGRLMIHPNGLPADPAFQFDSGAGPVSVIDNRRLFYDGNSQGGILGGGLVPFAPDFQRAVLGVPGMNYSTLLRRSVDFEPYAEGAFGEEVEGLICSEADQIEFIPGVTDGFGDQLEELCETGVPDDTPFGLYDNYPNELERPLLLALMQMLWDRAEANGVAHHMTSDPLANSPAHQVLLHPAFGDHQVANVTAEVEARTIGASVYQPSLEAGRHWEATPFMGIPAINSFPFPGSALVYWDGGDVSDRERGSATPPNENIPPRPDEGYGNDPHSYPRSDVKSRAQKGAFLAIGGGLLNYCTSNSLLTGTPSQLGLAIPCYADGFTGSP